MRIAWPDLAAALGARNGKMPSITSRRPSAVRRALEQLAAAEDGVLRAAGAASMLAGVLVLWLARD